MPCQVSGDKSAYFSNLIGGYLNPFPPRWTWWFCVGSRFLFCLFPKLLGIQITWSRYLKVCADLPKDNWNTFRTIGDLLETFSSKENPLLSCTMSDQNLKKFTFSKDGFPDGHNSRISFLVVSEASRHPNHTFKVSKSMCGLTWR